MLSETHSWNSLLKSLALELGQNKFVTVKLEKIVHWIFKFISLWIYFHYQEYIKPYRIKSKTKIRIYKSNFKKKIKMNTVAIIQDSYVCYIGSPFGSDSKASACSVGDPGLIPGSGRAPGVWNGNPLHYCCLENSMCVLQQKKSATGKFRMRTHIQLNRSAFQGRDTPWFGLWKVLRIPISYIRRVGILEKSWRWKNTGWKLGLVRNSGGWVWKGGGSRF